MRNFNDETKELISKALEKRDGGKKLNMDEKVLLRMMDGEWHEAAELAYNVSWRFGGYLHNLKKKGVEWEKERVPGTEARVFKYRLVELDGKRG